MSTRQLLISTILFLLPATMTGQKVSPLAYYIDKEGTSVETTSINDGEAPLSVKFCANPEDMGNWTPSFEWHFKVARKNENNGKAKELFVRYEEDTEYTFMESGTYNIVLKTTLKDGINEDKLDSVDITIVIAESKLEFPNAFSPNGDGFNDTYKAKTGWKNIVKFRAIILNRWGQKLYEWNDPAGEWDGTYNGHDVKEGVYFVQVTAKGSDGREYNIRKDVNLIRGYTEGGSTSDRK